MAGRKLILDKAGCEAAATSLDLSDVVAEVLSYSYYPPGCFWRYGSLSSCVLLFLIVLVFILRGASSKSTDANFARLKRVKRMSKLFGQMKILLSLVQIVASMPRITTTASILKKVIQYELITVKRKSCCYHRHQKVGE